MRNGPDKYIRAVEAAKYLGLTITEFLDGVKSGEIPQPYMLGLHRRWKLIELDTKAPEPTVRNLMDRGSVQQGGVGSMKSMELNMRP